jgi:hypothetical protein
VLRRGFVWIRVIRIDIFFDTGRLRAGVEGTVQNPKSLQCGEWRATSQLGERRAVRGERRAKNAERSPPQIRNSKVLADRHQIRRWKSVAERISGPCFAYFAYFAVDEGSVVSPYRARELFWRVPNLGLRFAPAQAIIFWAFSPLKFGLRGSGSRVLRSSR